VSSLESLICDRAHTCCDTHTRATFTQNAAEAELPGESSVSETRSDMQSAYDRVVSAKETWD